MKALQLFIIVLFAGELVFASTTSRESSAQSFRNTKGTVEFIGNSSLESLRNSGREVWASLNNSSRETRDILAPAGTFVVSSFAFSKEQGKEIFEFSAAASSGVWEDSKASFGIIVDSTSDSARFLRNLAAETASASANAVKVSSTSIRDGSMAIIEISVQGSKASIQSSMGRGSVLLVIAVPKGVAESIGQTIMAQ